VRLKGAHLFLYQDKKGEKGKCGASSKTVEKAFDPLLNSLYPSEIIYFCISYTCYVCRLL